MLDLADCDNDGDPADIHLFGICGIIVQLQFGLLIRILCGANLYKGYARVLEGCLDIVKTMLQRHNRQFL